MLENKAQEEVINTVGGQLIVVPALERQDDNAPAEINPHGIRLRDLA